MVSIVSALRVSAAFRTDHGDDPICYEPSCRFSASLTPVPSWGVPNSLFYYRERKHVLLKLRLTVLQEQLSPSYPIVFNGFVVGLDYELVDADEIEEPVLSAWRRDIGSKEGVVHRSQPLLTIKEDLTRTSLTLESVAQFASQRIIAIALCLPHRVIQRKLL